MILIATAWYIKQQVDQGKQQLEIQLRPYITIDFDLSRPPRIYLVIENTGNSIAENVSFNCKPQLLSSLDNNNKRASSFLDQTWPNIVQHKRIETFFDMGTNISNELFSIEYEVDIEYYSPALNGQQFKSKITLSLSPYQGLHFTD